MRRRPEYDSSAAARRRTLSLWPHVPSKPDQGDIGAPERVVDHPANLYHSNISLEMIILPFFMIIFLFSSFFKDWRLPPHYYDYFDKLLRLENVKLFSRQDQILDTRILILYRKLYINIVSIIVLNIEARQYNIKINLYKAVAVFCHIGLPVNYGKT